MLSWLIRIICSFTSSWRKKRKAKKIKKISQGSHQQGIAIDVSIRGRLSALVDALASLDGEIKKSHSREKRDSQSQNATCNKKKLFQQIKKTWLKKRTLDGKVSIMKFHFLWLQFDCKKKVCFQSTMKPPKGCQGPKVKQPFLFPKRLGYFNCCEQSKFVILGFNQEQNIVFVNKYKPGHSAKPYFLCLRVSLTSNVYLFYLRMLFYLWFKSPFCLHFMSKRIRMIPTKPKI